MPRHLEDGTTIEELEKAVHLAVITKCPWKYTLIDNETGQVYTGSNESNSYLPGSVLWKEVK
jgi:hypothetical protein